jgi:hypothetical protein
MMKVAILAVTAAAAMAAPQILPTPRYFEPLQREVRSPFSVQVAQSHPKMQLAAEFLKRELRAGEVHLWDYSADPKPPVKLNFLDREILENRNYWGQSYVLTVPDERAIWIVGASAQGVLLGAMTLLQLAGPQAVTAAYIRDWPDFEFRAASDWLLNIEINGWALDRGRGVEDFARQVEAKLDRALRYKINMALMDGFGFSLKKRPAFYGGLMRRLNRYARARGISLYFGGYGASYGMAYEPVVMYENGSAFKGTVFENRHGYPNGEKYRCMGFPHSRRGYDPATLGSCRSNEELNRLKAEEMREFVATVEPGALYIHHEDFGGFEGTAKAWRDRCESCRRRWPNDSLAAPDGGAGGLANGYSAFIRAINGVRNDAGYSAVRDCQILLVSPVYIPDRPESADWANTMELWRNIGKQLPPSENTQVCFREVWPLRHGGERFTERFAAMTQSAGLNLNTFLFYAGGADRFVSDYPLSGAPAMNALFLGARGIYNATGDFYQEPMELIAAEFSWNARAPGFRIPVNYTEAQSLLRSYAYMPDEPRELFASGGLYERVCEHLYGPKAGPLMARYYRLSAELPENGASLPKEGRPMTNVPLTWDRVYAAPSHWRHLIQDSHTWGEQIVDETFAAAVERMKLGRPELHKRLARRWRIASDLNRRGAALIGEALSANPLATAREDLEFLKRLLTVYQPVCEALAEYHLVLEGAGSGQITKAYELADRARQMALREFPEPIDPVGGEVGALRSLSTKLVSEIARRKGER